MSVAEWLIAPKSCMGFAVVCFLYTGVHNEQLSCLVLVNELTKTLVLDFVYLVPSFPCGLYTIPCCVLLEEPSPKIDLSPPTASTVPRNTSPRAAASTYVTNS